MVAKASVNTPMPSESSRTSAEVRSLAESLAREATVAMPRSDDWDGEEEPASPDQTEAERREAAAIARAAAEASARITAEAKARSEALDKARAEARDTQERAQAAERQAREEAEARAREQRDAEIRRAEERAREEQARVQTAQAAVDEAQKRALIAAVEDWARVWADKDLEAYLDFYHPDFYFKSKNMKLGAYRRYKTMLFENASIIEVEVSDFQVTREGGLIKVSFRQNYRSDNIRDLGRKTLTFKELDGKWKILAETWRAL